MAWLGRPGLPLGVRDQLGHVAQHPVAGLGLPDGPLEDRMDTLQAPGRELGREPIEPVVDVVGGQLGELGGPDQRDDVLLGQDAVSRNRVLIAALESLGQPVLDRLRHGVALDWLEASVPIGYSLDELVLDDGLRLALPLDPLAVPLSVESEADGSGEAVAVRIDRGLVLPD